VIEGLVQRVLTISGFREGRLALFQRILERLVAQLVHEGHRLCGHLPLRVCVREVDERELCLAVTRLKRLFSAGLGHPLGVAVATRVHL